MGVIMCKGGGLIQPSILLEFLHNVIQGGTKVSFFTFLSIKQLLLTNINSKS